MEIKKLNFLKNNNFVYFSRPNQIKTYLSKEGKETKKLPFDKDFSWKIIDEDNYDDFFDESHNTFFIITGELSNITVVDIDKEDLYDELLNQYEELENCMTVKTKKGYHIYFKYNDLLPNTSNINKLEGIDIRNDGGIIIAPPTKYKLLNGETAKYKYLGGEIHEIPQDFLEYLLPKKAEVKPQENKKKASKDEIVDLINLLQPQRATNYDDWIKIGIILYNELEEKGREIFHDFSQWCEKKYDENECDKKYDSFKNEKENKLTIGTLKLLAKEDSPAEYAELYKSNDAIKSTFSLLEKDIAEYIINNLLDNNFICVSKSSKEPEFYYFNGVCWVCDIANVKIGNIIDDKLIKEYETLLLNTTDEGETAVIKKLIKRLKGKLTFINSIIDWIARLTFNIKFFEIIDENPDLLCFSNGVYEINNKIFRDGKREDYITKTTGYEFPTADDYGHKKDIEQFLIKVFPDEEVRNFVLQTQAQALSGRKTQDLVYTHTGRGGNGKSILIEIIKNAFGDYFLNIPVSLLTSQNNSGHNTPDPFLAKFKGVRYAMSNEPKDGAKFNDSLIKNIGSQEALQYRLLYSNNPVSLNLQMKLNIYCNNKLKFNGEDEGIGRRMCVIDYVSKFVAEKDFVAGNENIYLMDATLTDKVKSWRQDYIKLLIGLFKNDYKHQPPKSVENSSKVYINENNDVYKFVKDNYIKTGNNNDFILLKDIKMEYQCNKEYEQTKLKTLKESLEKVFNANFIDDKKIKGKKYTSVMLGWKYNKLESDDDEKGVLD